MEKLTQIALPQATDAQLSGLGWTAGQIKEVRKYLKTPGYQRNAHQRALCRRYSDAQRLVTPATVEPRFTNGKVAKPKKATGTRRSSTKTRWSSEEFDLLISLYLKYVDGVNGVENATEVREEFQAVFPDRSSSAISLGLAQIKGLDAYHPAKGMKDTSALLISKLQEVDPNRFSA